MGQKVAMVTGTSSGIGKGIAIELARAGYDLFVTYNHNQEGAMDCVRKVEALGRRIIAEQCDIRQVSEIERGFAKFRSLYDHIDLLVNNAGITRMKPFLEFDLETFNDVIFTDLRGDFFTAQQAARYMVEKENKGVIINISSNHALGCWPGSTAYAAGKAGLNKFTMNCAMELAPYGIRVVGIAPGYTHIPEREEKLRAQGIDPNQREGYLRTAKRIPMGRFATPAEIGHAVVFLASENAGYITGTTLFIDGGSLLPVLADNTFS